MKKLFVKFSIVFLMIFGLTVFQDVYGRQGIPCDPDALPGEPGYCIEPIPLDTNVLYLLIGGVALYLVMRAKQSKATNEQGA